MRLEVARLLDSVARLVLRYHWEDRVGMVVIWLGWLALSRYCDGRK